MDDVKSVIQSKALWGALFAGIAPIFGLFGIAWSADDINFLTNTAVGIISAISALVTLVGSLMAFYGRLHATARIGGFVTPDAAKAPTPAGPA